MTRAGCVVGSAVAGAGELSAGAVAVALGNGTPEQEVSANTTETARMAFTASTVCRQRDAGKGHSQLDEPPQGAGQVASGAGARPGHGAGPYEPAVGGQR